MLSSAAGACNAEFPSMTSEPSESSMADSATAPTNIASGSEALIDERSAPSLAVVWLIAIYDDLESRSIPLKNALRVNISKGLDDGYLAFAPLVRSCGSGQTMEAALRDLYRDLLSVRDHLASERDDDLAGDARQLKKTISALLP